jgi:outer membrane protein assembly factor BamE (lipoprotein component of BamABCDE complex)
MTGSTLVRLLAFGLTLAGTVACEPVVATHGNMVQSDRLAQIHEGATRKAEVADVLGTPTATGTFDPSVWYYIGQRTEKMAWQAPEVVERSVLVVHFDPNGVVSKLDHLNASAGQEIDIVSRTTPTAGKDMSFLEQMMSNVGRFGTGKKSAGPGAPTPSTP